MRTDGKKDAFICGIIVFIGIMILLTDLLSVENLAWKAYAVLTGGYAVSLQLVQIFRDRRKKIFSAVALVISQSLNIAGFLTGLSAIKISLIVIFFVEEGAFAWFFRGIPSKEICSQADLRRFADRNGILKYNFLSNAVCVCGATALAYNTTESVVPYILILLLMISVTITSSFIQKNFLQKNRYLTFRNWCLLRSCLS